MLSREAEFNGWSFSWLNKVKPSRVASIGQLIMLTFVFQSQAQEVLTELTVDRPGIAEAPYTVGIGHFQFETGFDYYKRYNGKLLYLPTTLFRTGISRKGELRIATRHVLDQIDGKKFEGVAPLTVGIKYHIIKERKRIPETDILANLVIPVGNSPIQPKNLGYELLLLFENDFYPNSAINYNVGYIWDGFDQKDIFTFSMCYNYLPSEKVGLFLEYFFYVPYQWPGEQGIDGGITCLVRPRFMIDFSAGYSLYEKQSNFFVSSGFSFRMDSKRSLDNSSHTRQRRYLSISPGLAKKIQNLH